VTQRQDLVAQLTFGAVEHFAFPGKEMNEPRNIV
jgi:hypothetical protein